MLQLENLLLGLAIVGGAYAWYRIGFRTPTAMRVPAHALRRILVVCGWTLIVGITVMSLAAFLGDGRVQIGQPGQMYAYRSREPMRFWGEIAGDILLVGGTGAVLVVLGRRRARELL